jgi:hypothetical protein
LGLAYRPHTKRLRSICEENTTTIVDFIAAMKSEANLSDHYRKDLIEMLCRLSKYNNNMPFRDMTRADILGFLDYFRKPESGVSFVRSRYLPLESRAFPAEEPFSLSYPPYSL